MFCFRLEYIPLLGRSTPALVCLIKIISVHCQPGDLDVHALTDSTGTCSASHRPYYINKYHNAIRT